MFALSIRTRERDLEEEFGRFGTVEKATIVYDQRVSYSETLCMLNHPTDKALCDSLV